MKKLILGLLLFAFSASFAELVFEIPFDTDIVGLSFSENGPYEHTTDWMTMTNTGNETQTYTLLYTWDSLPSGWTFSLCNPVNCFIPNFPTPIELAAGASEQIHAVIGVESTDGFNFTITLSDGDLSEPIVTEFSFNTEDNTGVNDENQISVTPAILSQNYPNPFNPFTEIQYQLPQGEKVSLKVYNILGRPVRTLVDAFKEAGVYTVRWDRKDEQGKRVSSGIYLYRFQAGDFVATRKMILME